VKNPLKRLSLSRRKNKNPIAKILRDRRYRQLVIKNKKVYKRKNKWQDTETEHSEVS
jgi:hypothetical protein